MRGRPRSLLVRELALPVDALLRLAEADPVTYPVLFDSVSRGPLARHSVLVAAEGDALWLERSGRLGAVGSAAPHAQAPGFLDALERWWRAEAGPDAGSEPWDGGETHGTALAGTPPWCVGFAVFAGYELATEVERILRLPASPLPFVAFALRTRGALVADLDLQRIYAVAESGADGEAWLRRLEADAREALARAQAVMPPPRVASIDEDDPAEFVEGIRRVQDMIRAGELYQANLSRGWQAGLPAGTPIGPLYRRLRAANPAPFAVRAEWGGVAILSSSPERLMQIRAGRIATRPIAGTRPRRAGDPAADQAIARELVAHPKERAEHVMLIDLERNDLGRVCTAGSVRVDDFMTVETYAHVHHIVSGVSGELRPGVGAVGALRAVFPGGTITGCPKVRCMQAIGELEAVGRGAYTGSIGMLGLDGSADFNILIRTLTVHEGRARLRAGAGIVADSVPERELEETRAKARGVLAALESPP